MSGSRFTGSPPAPYAASKNQPIRGRAAGVGRTVLHHQRDPQVLGPQPQPELLRGLADHGLPHVLAVLGVPRGGVQQPVRVAGAGAAGEQHLLAAAQDEMDVDHFGVPQGHVGDQGVPLVGHLPAPEGAVVGERLKMRMGRPRLGEGA